MSMQETDPQPHALLVVYSMTYMLENYDSFICRIGAHPKLGGVIFIHNTGVKTLVQGLVLMLTLATPRLGFQIVKNWFFTKQSWARRNKIFQNKKILITKDIRAPEVALFIKSNQFNFLIHSRTTSFFKKQFLEHFKYGAINIHHGLLPKHRGLMCDFWAHLKQLPFGFSIHQMTAKIDDGPLLFRQELTKTKSYLQSAHLSAIQEAEACEKILDDLANKKGLNFQPQDQTETLYEKAPGLRHGYLLQLKGIKI